MSVTKELIENERQLVMAGQTRDVHLHKEGTFLRAYDWSAWLCCRYLHDFKMNQGTGLEFFKTEDDVIFE